MNKTSDQLAAEIVAFCTHVFEPLGEPVVKQQVKLQRPLEVIVGVTVEGVAPEAVKAACAPTALRAAWLAIWPQNCMGGCREKHIDISADKETVIFNLVFYSIELTPPDNLTRA